MTLTTSYQTVLVLLGVLAAFTVLACVIHLVMECLKIKFVHRLYGPTRPTINPFIQVQRADNAARKNKYELSQRENTQVQITGESMLMKYLKIHPCKHYTCLSKKNLHILSETCY